MTRLPSTRVLVALAVAVVAAAAVAASLWPSGSAAPRCSTFGTRWARSYDATAPKDHNPIRIASACCAPSNTPGLNSCFLTISFVGIRGRGCEQVDLTDAGQVASEGTHKSCPKA